MCHTIEIHVYVWRKSHVWCINDREQYHKAINGGMRTTKKCYPQTMKSPELRGRHISWQPLLFNKSFHWSHYLHNFLMKKPSLHVMHHASQILRCPYDADIDQSLVINHFISLYILRKAPLSLCHATKICHENRMRPPQTTLHRMSNQCLFQEIYHININLKAIHYSFNLAPVQSDGSCEAWSGAAIRTQYSWTAI